MDSIKAKSKWRAIGFSIAMVGVYFLNSILVGIVCGLSALSAGVGDNFDIKANIEQNSIYVISIISLVSIVVFGIILYCKQKSCKNYSTKPFVSFNKVNKKEIIESIILFLGMYGIAFLWINLVDFLSKNNVFFKEILETHNNVMGELTNSRSFMLIFVIVAVIVPITEELFFRGLIYGRLRQAMKPIVAMFISALLFAFFHGNVLQGVYTFFIGFVLALVYEKTGSLYLSIFGHFLINIIGTSFPYFGLEIPYLILGIISCIALIPSIMILKKWFIANNEMVQQL